MQLSFNDLRKKDVINVADARCLGRITDIILRFPEGNICAIVVPGRKVWGFRLFDRSELVIEERKIVRIGNDVILVNINMGDCYSGGKHCPPPPPKKGGGNRPSCEDFLSDDCRIDKSDY